jgi:hypothetical protein
MKITVKGVLAYAAGLASEHGENPEYDRALVELARDLTGMTREEVEAKILKARG